MNLFSPKGNRFWFRLGLALVAVSGALVLLPTSFGSRAGASAKKDSASTSPFHITRSDAAGLENFDIRTDKASAQKIADMRTNAGRGAADLAATQQDMLNAAAELRQSVSSLEIEYSTDLGAPEVIGTNVLQRTFLTGRTGSDINEKHADMVKAFLTQNNELIGLNRGQVTNLNVIADYANPRGNLAWVDLGQEINGIPVFKGEVRAAITKNGEIARMINNLAPGLDYASLPTEGMSAADAVMYAARDISHIPTKDDVQLRSTENGGKVVTFYTGQFSEPPRAELMYFPLEPGLARLAWRVSLWEPVAAYYIVVDAQTGEMLWRKNTTQDQTQSASYNVYTGENPAPLSPSNSIPGAGIQGASVARSTVTLIGNEAPNPGQNNLGWITDGNNFTDGNNVQAGLDIDGSDGVDAPVTGSSNRVFDFAYAPPPGGAEAPSLAAYRNGVVTNMFYWTNRYHDLLYGYGFTEAARNFQNDNFGRGGVALDRVRSESQDSSGINNANFNTQADGIRGRMQMYIFTSPTPDRDGDLDQEISIHEMTHGLSNRLIGNAVGLNNNRGGSMGEGWGDFYGRLITSTADEDVNGVYASGAYATQNFQTVGNDNYYYGIRRFPYASITTTGGPLNRPHNPQTFADIDPAQINNTDGAYAKSTWVSNSATEVHNAGEIWCQMLLEVRARMITRMGYAAGNDRMFQITTDGMKLTPTSPNFIQARNAIIAADIAGFGGTDTGDIWRGFAVRGAGFGAQDGLPSNAVIQSFALPNLTLGNVTFTDLGGNNNGFADPGEPIVLSVPLVSQTSDPYNSVTATVAGITANYGTVGAGTVSQNINYTVPAATPCGNRLTIPVDINSSFGPTSGSFVLQVGSPVFGFTEQFDAVAAPALPAGWTTAVTGSGVAWATSATTPDTAPNAIFTSSPATTSSSDITTPDMAVPSAASRLTFRINYDTEGTFDGAVMEISISGGAFSDFITAGGAFLTGGYVSILTGGGTNPLQGRNSWNGSSNGYITVLANLPPGAAGQNIKLKFRNGTDTGTAGPGVRIDGVRIINSYNCAPVVVNNRVRADFDGDNKSDVSVVRGGGTWYLNQSTAGMLGVSFGTSGDIAVPGDYDGDNKTDVAVFRPSANAWYLLRSSAGFTGYIFGSAGDIPVARDFDGDGKTDIAVYRPSNNTWYAIRSSDNSLYGAVWGVSGDIPVIGDFDGDTKADPTVFRPSNGTWYTLKSSGGKAAAAWGLSGDSLAPADYDGDHKDDYAVFRSGTWYILNSAGGSSAYAFGLTGDVPVPGDYDGDGKYDVGVYRGGNWYLLRSTAGLSTQSFGLASDVPVPSRYIP